MVKSYLELDNLNKEKFKDLILMCLLDLDNKKVRSFNIKFTGDGIKVWLYHKVSVKELENYEDYYKKEIKEIKKKINIK